MSDRDKRETIDALLQWYVRERRDLPWRAAPGELADPYHTLVAETMLQQTQVATVIGYFRRFVARFPSLADLAACEQDAVLAAWQGLGYYRRARNLHAAAQAIVREHGGAIPDDVRSLLRLPGVGRYTAGAVASIAFGRCEPAVDGNVARVLARIEAYTGAAESGAGRAYLWRSAAAWVARSADEAGRHAGDWNQAVMELGARVCTPRNPACDGCPVAAGCQARRRGEVDRIPPPARRPEPRRVTHRVLAMRRGERWLLERRDEAGMWAGLWQIPTQDTDEPTGRDAAGAGGLSGWALDRFGLGVGRVRRVGAFEHVTTHRRVRFEVFSAVVRRGRLRAGAGRWRRLGDVSDLALSRAQHRVVELIRRAENTQEKSPPAPVSH